MELIFGLFGLFVLMWVLAVAFIGGGIILLLGMILNDWRKH